MAENNPFYLGMISTVSPRKCGIATFNGNLYDSVKKDSRLYDSGLFSIVNGGSQEYKSNIQRRVHFEIEQHNPSSWKRGIEQMVKDAKYRAAEGVPSAFILQHEYGIYGSHHDSDDHAVEVLRTLKQNNIPAITVAHTLLSEPSAFKRDVMRGIIKYSDKVIGLTPSAIDRLEDDEGPYNAPRGKLLHIEHGVPPVAVHEPRETLKRRYGFVDVDGSLRPVISNVGFLSSGKGIEYALEGLAGFLQTNPAVRPVYCVAGQTHPEVLKSEGEEYREKSLALARDLGLKVINHKGGLKTLEGNFADQDVVFWDDYLTNADYSKFIQMSDVGLVTNQAKDQISSGQIAAWVGMERPIIATESPYSKDMEKEGVGLLTEFGNSAHVADRLGFYFKLSPEKRRYLEDSASGKASGMRWPIVGQKYLNLVESIVGRRFHQ